MPHAGGTFAHIITTVLVFSTKRSPEVQRSHEKDNDGKNFLATPLKRGTTGRYRFLKTHTSQAREQSESHRNANRRNIASDRLSKQPDLLHDSERSARTAYQGADQQSFQGRDRDAPVRRRLLSPSPRRTQGDGEGSRQEDRA